MEATFDQHIGVFEDAVPKDWCDKVIKTYEDNSYNSFSRQELEKITTLHKKDNSIGLHFYNKELCKTFSKNLINYFYKSYSKEYQLDSSIIDEASLIVSDFKVQKTLPTGGYHLWHTETSILEPFRVMVYTVYLNDVEEGGETEFLIQSLRVKPKKGTVVIFPAGYTHIHRGNPPLSGEKYIMTGWIEYDPRIYFNHHNIKLPNNE
jgi:hypothetical protein